MTIITRYWRDLRSFVHLLAVRFHRDDIPAASAELTFTSLLSLVPLMAVSLALLSAFPIGDRIGEQLQNFVFSNFVPASGEVIKQYMQDFSSKAGRLTGAGAVFLLVTALMLMHNIDRVFNRIWAARRRLNPLSTFITYWAILTIGPLLMGLSVALTSYLMSLPLFSEPVAELELWARLLHLAPAAASALGFFLLYLVVPNRPVRVRHALAGALIAAALFEPAKRAFGWYLTAFPGYEAIYGAMAAIPVFLIWIYISWLITLFGGMFTACLGAYRRDFSAGGYDRPTGLAHAYHSLFHLWRAQRKGETLSLSDLLEHQPRIAADVLENILLELSGAGLVLRSDEGRWALAKNADEIGLRELHRHVDHGLLDVSVLNPELSADHALLNRIGRLNEETDRVFDVSLGELFRGDAE